MILVTGHGTVPSAVAAMQQGAYNYLLKPLDLGQLRAVTENAAANLRLRRHQRRIATAGWTSDSASRAWSAPAPR